MKKNMENMHVSFDGTQIYYVYERGEKPITMIFVHGVGGNWTVWKNIMHKFQKKGFSTIAIDLRGHGNSDSPTEFERYKLENFSRDIYEIIKKENIKNFILIGDSLGGAISINFSSRYKIKELKSMILIEAAITYPFQHNRVLNNNPLLVHLVRFLIKHEKTQEEFTPHLKKPLKEIDLSKLGISAEINLVHQFLHLLPLTNTIKILDNAEQYILKNKKRTIDKDVSKLKIPLLVIGGKLDTIVPLEYSKEIAKLNKQAKLKILEDADHHVLIKHPDEIYNETNKFLKKYNYFLDYNKTISLT